MPVQDEVTVRPPKGVTLGRTFLVLLLTVELAAVGFYGWQRVILRGWQAADPSTLRTSPDAAYLYQSVFGDVQMARGFLLGLLAVSIGIAAAAFLGRGGKPPTTERILVALPAVVPLVALILLRV